MDLFTRIESITGQGFYKTNHDLLDEIYQEVFNKPIHRSCSKCIIEAYNELRSYLRTKQKSTIMAQKYRLTKKIRHHAASGKVVTVENFTDEDAEEMLKNEDLKAFIEEIPAKEKEAPKELAKPADKKA